MKGTSYRTRTRWATSCRKCHKNMPAGAQAICTPTEPTQTQYAHPTCATAEQIAEADENHRANVAALWPD